MPSESVSFERWIQRIEDKIDGQGKRIEDKIDKLDEKLDTQGNRITAIEVKVETRPVVAGALGGFTGVVAAVAVAIYQAMKGSGGAG